jgi:tetratricopeptide (TPR) repeat protein
MKKTVSLLSVAAAAGIDAYVLYLILAGPGSYLLPAGLHLGSVLLMVLATVLVAPETYQKHKSTTLAFVIAFTLPVPLAGILALVAFRLLFKIKPVEDPSRKYVFGDRRFLTVERPEVSLRKTHQSILDVLSSRNNALRRTAILALRAVEAKKSLPVLIKAIGDSDEQVRLLAQTQFNKIIAALELTIKQMEAELGDFSADSGKLIQLAEQYHELVYLGLSSEETEQLYLDRAIQLLRLALKSEPENKGARFFLLKCLIKRGLLGEAEECLNELQQAGFQDDFLRVWRADVLYQKRDWAALERTLNEMRQSKGTDPRLGGMLEFWLGTQGLQTLT